MILKKDNAVLHGEIKNGHFIGTVKVVGRFVTNPTLEQLTTEGWEEHIPQQEAYSPTYKERVIQRIRRRYDYDDEIGILRQRDTKTDEFNAYNEYVEQCKAAARAEKNFD